MKKRSDVYSGIVELLKYRFVCLQSFERSARGRALFLFPIYSKHFHAWKILHQLFIINKIERQNKMFEWIQMPTLKSFQLSSSHSNSFIHLGTEDVRYIEQFFLTKSLLTIRFLCWENCCKNDEIHE